MFKLDRDQIVPNLGIFPQLELMTAIVHIKNSIPCSYSQVAACTLLEAIVTVFATMTPLHFADNCLHPDSKDGGIFSGIHVAGSICLST